MALLHLRKLGSHGPIVDESLLHPPPAAGNSWLLIIHSWPSMEPCARAAAGLPLINTAVLPRGCAALLAASHAVPWGVARVGHVTTVASTVCLRGSTTGWDRQRQLGKWQYQYLANMRHSRRFENCHCKNVPFLGTMSVCRRGRRAGLDENMKVSV